MYSGKVNTLTIRRKYGTVYKCNFDLALYPFDDQQCEMRLRITSELKSFLVFDHEKSSVEYLSNPFLVEYEVIIIGPFMSPQFTPAVAALTNLQ